MASYATEAEAVTQQTAWINADVTTANTKYTAPNVRQPNSSNGKRRYIIAKVPMTHAVDDDADASGTPVPIVRDDLCECTVSKYIIKEVTNPT